MSGSNTKVRLIELYRQMYELTEPECRCSCKIPRSCCLPEYCQMAIQVAEEDWGVDLKPLQTDHPTLPFMGPEGCVVEPHLRPLCTLHTCDINSFGFKMHPQPDVEWDAKYWELREEIENLQWKLHDGE